MASAVDSAWLTRAVHVSPPAGHARGPASSLDHADRARIAAATSTGTGRPWAVASTHNADSSWAAPWAPTAVCTTGQARQPCRLKPGPHVPDRRFGSGVEEQLKRVPHGSPSALCRDHDCPNLTRQRLYGPPPPPASITFRGCRLDTQRQDHPHRARLHHPRAGRGDPGRGPRAHHPGVPGARHPPCILGRRRRCSTTVQIGAPGGIRTPQPAPHWASMQGALSHRRRRGPRSHSRA